MWTGSLSRLNEVSFHPMPTTLIAAVLHPYQDQVLALADAVELPTARLATAHWHAEHGPLGDALAAALGRPVRLLRRLAAKDEPDPSGDAALAERRVLFLAELVGEAPDRAPAGWHWIGPAATAEIADEWTRSAIRDLFPALAGRPTPPFRPPWAVERSGWWSELRGWMDDALARSGRAPRGEPRPVKVWCLAAVYQQETDQGSAYLKVAAPAPPLFVDEARMTADLARRFPDCMPRVLAARPGPGWLLMEDDGPTLIQYKSLSATERRALTLRLARDHAALQLASAGQVDGLLAAGCIDRRLEGLADEVSPLLADPLTAAAVEPAELERLRRAEGEIRRAIDRLAALALPAALVHGDLHFGNALLRGDTPVFIDWTDACIGPPMVDLLVPFRAEDPELAAEWRAVYLEVWQSLVSRDRLEEAWRLNEIILPLHHCVSYRSLLRHVEPADRRDLNGGLGRFAPALAAAVGP